MSNNQTPLRIEGYLGKDPEMRYTPNGKGLVEFSVADTYSWKNERGEWQDITTWFRCTAWGESRAEYVSKYYKKGDPVIVEGRLQPDKETGGPRVYKREDGTHGAQFDVTIQNIRKMMQRKNGDTSHSDEHIDISLGTNANEEISFID